MSSPYRATHTSQHAAAAAASSPFGTPRPIIVAVVGRSFADAPARVLVEV